MNIVSTPAREPGAEVELDALTDHFEGLLSHLEERMSSTTPEEATNIALSAISPEAMQHLLQASAGWTTIGGNGGLFGTCPSPYDIPNGVRTSAARQSRAVVASYPTAARAAEYHTAFVVGPRGVSWEAPGRNKNAAFEAIKNDPLNRDVFSLEGQRRTFLKLLCDGEILIYIRNVGATAACTPLDPTTVTGISKMRGFPDIPSQWAFAFATADPTTSSNSSLGTVTPSAPYRVAYRDYRHLVSPVGAQIGPTPIKDYPTEPSGYIYHYSLGMGHRGTPYFLSSLPFFTQTSTFLKARIAIMMAIHRIAIRVSSRTGNKSVAQAIAARLTSTVSASNPLEANPPPVAGSILTTNGVDYDPMKFETGAAGAVTDTGLLRSMEANGSGILSSWIGGDGSNSLSAAAGLEIPQRATFEQLQGTLDTIYSELATLALIIAGKATPRSFLRDDDRIDVTTAPVESRADPGRMTAFARVLEVLPELRKSPAIVAELLRNMRIEHANTVANEVELEVPEKSEPQPPRSDFGEPRGNRSTVPENQRGTPDGGPDDPNTEP